VVFIHYWFLLKTFDRFEGFVSFNCVLDLGDWRPIVNTLYNPARSSRLISAAARAVKNSHITISITQETSSMMGL
jgi:hypothetical protein